MVANDMSTLTGRQISDSYGGALGADFDIETSGNAVERESINWLHITTTVFKIDANSNHVNGSTDNYIYLAIRRPDGSVGKPAEAGTDVFAMDTGTGSSTIPNFDSGFPVDFALDKSPASSGNWDAAARLISDKLKGFFNFIFFNNFFI